MIEHPTPRLWLVMPLAAMAGGMGWGIRGQYGHETGAMIAGVLVGLVLVLFFCARCTSLFSARAVAMCALGISIGGSMTYGQTLGLTHDKELFGNVEALRWGLLGLAVKGGIWIGFAAAFLSIALSETRYRPLEVALLLLVLVFLYFLGIELLNRPFDPYDQFLPEGRQLPAIYFSDHWHWEPDRALEHRRECWGGLLFALVGLYIYMAGFRADRLALWLVPWGVLGGAIGFPAGQSLQAFHAWHPEVFAEGWLSEFTAKFNWWNMMETTFGAIAGALVALGLWLNRRRIRPPEPAGASELTLPAEWGLAAVHVAAVVAWNLGSFGALDRFAGIAITMTIIPAVATMAGRLWPYLVALPIVAVPIAGKTLRDLSYGEAPQLPPHFGWLAYVALPIGVALMAAVLLARGSTRPASGGRFARWALFVATWLYFGLNLAFFRFPWPWLPREEWTGRTPNGIIFFVCALGLTVAALFAGRVKSSDDGTAQADSPASPKTK